MNNTPGGNHMKYPILIVIALILFLSPNLSSGDIHDGDILFQDFQSAQSTAVKIATNSEYTHCGIVFHDDSGRVMVWEAVQPVCITPFETWIGRDKDSAFVLKRLKGADTLLNDSAIEVMKEYGRHHLGKKYDLYFNWDDSRFYCSEYVWKIIKTGLGIELSPLRKIKDYNLDHPLVQMKLKERYGDNIPYDEPVVSPQDLFESELLDRIDIEDK